MEESQLCLETRPPPPFLPELSGRQAPAMDKISATKCEFRSLIHQLAAAQSSKNNLHLTSSRPVKKGKIPAGSGNTQWLAAEHSTPCHSLFHIQVNTKPAVKYFSLKGTSITLSVS